MYTKQCASLALVIHITSLEDTLEGKLPQKKITQEAARGYSSYGNQIGLATGEVKEYYHPGYVAKRMEIGAVIGAAPRNQVRRETPVAGDVVVLLGGKTGRDGCGGATGSSKEHTVESLFYMWCRGSKKATLLQNAKSNASSAAVK